MIDERSAGLVAELDLSGFGLEDLEIDTSDMRQGPFSEYSERCGWVHYGSNWPENPFDWRFGCTMVRVVDDE